MSSIKVIINTFMVSYMIEVLNITFKRYSHVQGHCFQHGLLQALLYDLQEAIQMIPVVSSLLSKTQE